MKPGRPKALDSRKKSEKIFVNLTKEQKKQLLKISEKEDQSLSYICLRALKQAGHLKG